MASEFSTEFFSANRIVKADLRAARTPREEDLERIKKEVGKLYDATEVILNVTVDDSLISGYVLQIGDRVFDNSGRHAIDQMMADKPSLATLKTRIEDYKPAATSEEGGVVISSADGIVEVEGMDRAVYGEIVTFENGAKGMVESVEPGRLGIMLFDGAETVGVGTMVTRSGKLRHFDEVAETLLLHHVVRHVELKIRCLLGKYRRPRIKTSSACLVIVEGWYGEYVLEGVHLLTLEDILRTSG